MLIDTDIELVEVLNEYLSELPGSPVKSLEKLVEWNKEHAEEALPIGILPSSHSCVVSNCNRISKPGCADRST